MTYKLSLPDLEFLDRLVDRGEGLMLEGLTFGSAEALMRENLAEIKSTYDIPEGKVHLIVPTEAGKTLAAIRENEKLARIKAWGAPKPMSLPTKKE